jgi:hypothetical protein
MTRAQKGDAIDSMAASWDQDEPGTLPMPEEHAAKIIGITVKQLTNFRRTFPKFWQLQGDLLVNPKLRSQWGDLQQIKRSQSDAAKRTNEKLGRKPSVSDTVSDTVTETLTDPTASATAKHSLAGKRSRTRASRLESSPSTALLEKFLADYPQHRVNEAKTRRLFMKLSENDQLRAVEVLSAWKASSQWQDEGGRFVPGSARFLEEKIWKRHPNTEKGGTDARGTRKNHGVRSGRDTDYNAGRVDLPEL